MIFYQRNLENFIITVRNAATVDGLKYVVKS